MSPSIFNKRALAPFSLSILAAALVSCGGSGSSSSGDRLPEGSKLIIMSNPSYNAVNHEQQHSFALHVAGSGSDLCPVWLNNSSNQVGNPSSSPVAVIYRRSGKTATFSMSAEFTQSQIVLPGPVIEYTSLKATISATITYPNDHPSSTGLENGTCVYSANFVGSRSSEYPVEFNFNDIPDGQVIFYPVG